MGKLESQGVDSTAEALPNAPGATAVSGADRLPARAVRRVRSLAWPTLNGRSAGVLLLFLLWFFVFFDPHWFIAAKGVRAATRVPLVFFALLAVFLAFRFRPRTWYFPLAAYMAWALLATPFTINLLYARNVSERLVLLYILALGTMTFAWRGRDFMPLFMLLLLSYLWFGLFGALSGNVAWHPTLANDDGFGPLAVMGLGFCYYFAASVRSRPVRYLALGTAVLCVIGLVTSFARGAVLSAVVVGVVLWLRSPRKLRTGGFLVVAVLVVTVSSAIFFPGGAFWAEIKSSFTEGTTEGTGEDRKHLWGAGFDVFQARPLLGAGPGNFGPFAAEYFKYGEVGGRYGENPRQLYTQALHSIFFQQLSEGGIIGSGLWLFLFVDFWRRNMRLRSRRYTAAWAMITQGEFRLRELALALEMVIITYLATGFFYDQLYTHYAISMMILNATLDNSVRRADRRLRAYAATPP